MTSSSRRLRSSAEFLALTHPVDTHRWELKVDPSMTGGRGSLFGGVGLAAGIVALEQATGKPVIWATGQYLAITQQPVTIDLEVQLPAQGRHVTQGRVVGHVGDREIITVIGAVGERPGLAAGCWVECPQAPPPEACPEIARSDEAASLHDHVDLRLVRGAFGFTMFGRPTDDGRSLFWARMTDVENDAAALGIIADYMPSVLGNALGRVTHCTSLDNTIRFANRRPTEWVLCDNRMEYVGNGFGHGTVHLWSQDGVLLATGSQSLIVRPVDDR
ncbi:acyl-CoA thioesterase [Zavarzinia sp. CC-PAN008]|uniref:acyl-CoA thioesterase n=1 Tax=Zavarzinia sp. CC-PAN008 TaxID=3243332 RepID=UPI003F74817F